MSGDRMGAIDDYEEAVRYDPSNAEAHFSLGFSYLLLKRKLEANEQAKALDDIDAEMAARLRALIGAISEGGRPPAEGPSAQSDSPMTP
jgi:tetratricopeptide (TPR) repeat protein